LKPDAPDYHQITLKFSKLVGAGNDFVFIDCTDQELPRDPTKLAQYICAQHLGIGSDGLVLFERISTNKFRIICLNPDGSKASMCGNALRCAALFSQPLACPDREISIEISETAHTCIIRGEQISCKFSPPHSFRGPIHVEGHDVFCLNTGTEHAVVFLPSVAAIDVEGEGRMLRYHSVFAPLGTNINFVEIINPCTLRIRTYERYLERETLSCGTGAVASVLVSRFLGRVSGNQISALNRTDEPLLVSFRGDTLPFEEIWLSGPARTVYKGEFLWREK